MVASQDFRDGSAQGAKLLADRAKEMLSWGLKIDAKVLDNLARGIAMEMGGRRTGIPVPDVDREFEILDKPCPSLYEAKWPGRMSEIPGLVACGKRGKHMYHVHVSGIGSWQWTNKDEHKRRRPAHPIGTFPSQPVEADYLEEDNSKTILEGVADRQEKYNGPVIPCESLLAAEWLGMGNSAMMVTGFLKCGKNRPHNRHLHESPNGTWVWDDAKAYEGAAPHADMVRLSRVIPADWAENES